MKLRALLSLAAALLAATPTLPAAPESVSLTHIANEGLLIEGSKDRVLIDAIFTTSFGIFEVPSPAELAKMTQAEAPYDKLTCVLATHDDGDHESPAEVVEHLANDRSADFFAPAEVVEQMKGQPRFAELGARVHAINVNGLPQEQRFDTGLVVKAYPLAHLKRPPSMPRIPYNVGHLFTIDGITFFHTGDMNPQNLETLRTAKLREAQVDVVLVNCYFFAEETLESARAILAYLNPKLVLLSHMPTKGALKDPAPILALTGFPKMIALDQPMQAYTVSREGDHIVFTKR